VDGRGCQRRRDPTSGIVQLLEADFFAVDFLVVDFLAVDFLAVPEPDELEPDELEEPAFLAGAFFAVELLLDFLAVDVPDEPEEPDELEELAFFAGAFFALDFVAVELLDFFAVEELDELDVLAGAFFAVAVLFLAVEEVFFAVEEADFFVVVDAFFAVELVFLAAVEAFLAGAFAAEPDELEPADVPVAFLATSAALMAGCAATEAAFFAGAVAFLATSAAFCPALEPRTLETARSAGFGSLGSFLAPETTAFRSAPAVNFGTAVFLAFTRSPVRGLRTQRASRTRFSKEPKPVMATFSPRATSRVMVSRTDSSACWACLRFPS
jgi:hypothetical protein